MEVVSPKLVLVKLSHCVLSHNWNSDKEYTLRYKNFEVRTVVFIICVIIATQLFSNHCNLLKQTCCFHF